MSFEAAIQVKKEPGFVLLLSKQTYLNCVWPNIFCFGEGLRWGLCTGQERTGFCLVALKTNLPCVWPNIFCFGEGLRWGLCTLDPQREDLFSGMFIVMIGPVVPQIWSFEAIRQVWTFALMSRTQRVNLFKFIVISA